MRSDILSSNFGLLNIGSSSSASSSSDRNRTSIFPSVRRTRKTSNQQGHLAQVQIPAPRTEDAEQRASRTRRPLGQATKHSISEENTPAMEETSSRLRRSGSLRGAKTRPALVALSSENSINDSDDRRSASSTAGTKRKRPSLQPAKTGRSGSAAISRAASSQQVENYDVLPASHSRSTSAAATHDYAGMRRSSSSRSSISLRNGMTNLMLSESRRSSDAYQPESPTRTRTSRGRNSRTTSASSANKLGFGSSQEAPLVLGSSSSEDEDARNRRIEYYEIDDDDDDDDDDAQLISDSENDDSSADEAHLQAQDEQLLSSASFWQLERVRKDRLERLATHAGIVTEGLTKSAIINAIIECRSEPAPTGPPSSNTRSGKSRSSLTSRLSQPPSDHSADYTDDHGDDAVGDESVVFLGKGPIRPHKSPHLRRIKSHHRISPNKASPVKRAFGKRATQISPHKTRAVQRALGLTGQGDGGAATMAAPSPMVNRLRKQKSLVFAASSPIRTRGRARPSIPNMPHQDANSSPLRHHLRPRRRGRGMGPDLPQQPEKSVDDQMDEDWIDSVSLSRDGPSRAKTLRGKGTSVRRASHGAESADDEESDGDEMSTDDDDDDDDEGKLDQGQDELEGEVATPAHGSDESAEEDEDADATIGEDTFATRQRSTSSDSDGPDDDEDGGADSDRTDGPGRNGHRAASPTSPTKVRRLRNGKLRIAPPLEVEDTDVEVDAALSTQAPPTARPTNANGSGSSGTRRKSSASKAAVKTIKANGVSKPKTPPLSTDNEAMQSPDAENLDELNGLDLESLNLTDKEIPPRQLQKASRIGSGGFKDVYVGIWKVGKRRNKVAIADIREKLTEMDIKELGLLRDLKHENIVRFIGVSIPEDTARTGIPCMIVSELCSNGDLWDYVRGTKPPSQVQIFQMLLETARGLEYLHMHSIVHRDVKSSNVLVTRNRSCKINDFGLARVKKSQRSKMKSVVGTVNWQAVELWCKAPNYNEKVDVWSAAMTFWEALQWHEDYKSYPFEGMNDFEIYEDVGKNGLRPPTDALAQLFGEGIVKLLNRMWDADPRKRPTMDMVCVEMEKLLEMKKIESGQ